MTCTGAGTLDSTSAAVRQWEQHQVGKEDEAKQEEEAFAAEDIDQILAGRTDKRQIGNRKGNTFSTATFGASNDVLVGLYQ